MAQTPHDLFKLPFRAFGVELNADDDIGEIHVVDLACGRHLRFVFQSNFFITIFAGEKPTGSGILLEARCSLHKQDKDTVLWNDSCTPHIVVRSWTALADAFEPLLAPFTPATNPAMREIFPMDEETHKVNSGALFRFIRFFETGDGMFEKHYRLVEEPRHEKERKLGRSQA